MSRRFVPATLALVFVLGCAGPAKLAQRSEEKLASGENSRAWELAVRALDRDPGNARARAAATAAGNALARDREARIHALAQSDSAAAAEQVLALCSFRVGASRYAAVTVSPSWAAEEQVLRQTAARTCYRRGTADLAARRPRGACQQFGDAQRFVPEFRDAARRADQAYELALARVAVVPFTAASGNATLGRDVAAAWRDGLARQVAAPDARFTRILGSAATEERMTVAQLGRLSRADAVDLAQQAGAQRVVWGSIGEVEAKNRLQLFADVIARRVVQKNSDGSQVTRWVDVPVEVVARVRTVTVDVAYELIAAKEGATLAHQQLQRSTSARIVWTSFNPDGDLGDYALVSDLLRAANPERAKQVESHWQEVCGEGTTLRQVLEARRSTRSSGHYDSSALPRFVAGAAFVFLQELPPVDDLAFAALSGGWQPLRDDLLRLDLVDDVDLGMAAVSSDAR